MVRYQPPMDWQQWVNWLAAGLHGRNRWRLSLILLRMPFAKGHRTVTAWLRAAGVHDDFADYYYFLQPISLARRAAHPAGWQTIECLAYGNLVSKTIKTFWATYRPAGGVIRVVIVREDHGCQFFFSTEPTATPREIVETFADRATIEQDFHDVKEVWGAGQQQVRNIWTNIAVFNLNLWMHTLVECWAWNRSVESIRNRADSPWDDADRRPSHADRRKALRRETLQNQYSELSPAHRRSSKIRNLYRWLLQLAA